MRERTTVKTRVFVMLWLAILGLVASPAAIAQTGDSDRIVGGAPAAEGQFPYQVFLRITVSGGTALCGGSILSTTVVITAAHCVDTSAPGDVEVNAGTIRRDVPGVIRSVSEILVHPQWTPATSNNDLALLRLSTPLTFSSAIAAVPLIASNQLDLIEAGDIATVSGFGRTAEGGQTSTELRFVEVPIVSQTVCNTAYSGAINPDTMLCAGLDAGGKDSCQGDSGGPLVVRNASSQFVLAGIVSFGEGCARPAVPGVYTRVVNFLSLINTFLGGGGGGGGGATAPVFSQTSGCGRTFGVPTLRFFNVDTLDVSASGSPGETIRIRTSDTFPGWMRGEATDGNPATARLSLSPNLLDLLFTFLAPDTVIRLVATSSPSNLTANCVLTFRLVLL